MFVTALLIVKVDHWRQRIIKNLPMDNMTALASHSVTETTITTSTGIKTGKLLAMEAAVVVHVASTEISKIMLRAKRMGKLKHYIPPPFRRRLLHQFPMGDIYHIETEKTIL